MLIPGIDQIRGYLGDDSKCLTAAVLMKFECLEAFFYFRIESILQHELRSVFLQTKRQPTDGG
ncbi:hypothetical protein SAMN04487894_111119 [Niabella drilacis]|uniref:Uncharacterized protein n=1 Tax=Niabella drilacis (strain DSM 25811 / CCM 8410 / CCUG 62505 / LMG 26954 / E90) TaxID=1285928 RepID=A0A1G6WHW9_NIADE|nr:hypothetical protein SAMN04487894_111119 [Niabella drilacis]